METFCQCKKKTKQLSFTVFRCKFECQGVLSVCSCPYTWSLRRMSMPVGPCLYTWLIVPSGRLHTHAILRINSAAVSSSRYRAWYTAQKWKGVVQRPKPQSLKEFFLFFFYHVNQMKCCYLRFHWYCVSQPRDSPDRCTPSIWDALICTSRCKTLECHQLLTHTHKKIHTHTWI